MSINHNQSAERSAREFKLSGEDVNKQMLKVATGKRIVMASDDPSALSLESTLLNYTNSLEQASFNARQAVQVTEIIDTSLKSVTDNLRKMQLLSDRAANAFISDEDRANINIEFQQAKEEINRISDSTKYGKVKLLSGDNTKNKMFTGSDIDGVDKVTFRSGVKDDFMLTASDNGLKLTSMHDPSKTQLVKSFKAGEIVSFDKLGVTLSTNENFSLDKVMDANQSFKGKFVDSGDLDFGKFSSRGIEEVRFNNDLGNITYDLSIDKNKLTLTNMSSGTSETIEYNLQDETLYFSKLDARVDINAELFKKSIDYKALNQLKIGSSSEGIKSKVHILVDRNQSQDGLFDFKYDSSSNMLTVRHLMNDKESYSNVSLDNFDPQSSGFYEFSMEGKRHAIFIEKGFNALESIDYNKGVNVETLKVNRVEYNKVSLENVSMESAKGDFSHLSGELYVDKGVKGSKLVLESKTGDHLYSDRYVDDILKNKGLISFSNDAKDTSVSLKMDVHGDFKSAIKLQEVTIQSSKAQESISLYKVENNNSANVNIESLIINFNENEPGELNDVEFVDLSDNKLKANAQSVSMNINGEMKEGFLLDHSSEVGNISLFVTRNDKFTEFDKSVKVDISKLLDFKELPASFDIKKAFEGKSSISNNDKFELSIKENNIERGSLNNVKITSVNGELSSIDLSKDDLEFVLEGNGEMSINLGGFKSDKIDYDKVGSQKTVLIDKSNPNNSITVEYNISQKIKSNSGNAKFDAVNVLNRMVYNIAENNDNKTIDKLSSFNDYKMQNIAITTSKFGVNANQISENGVSKIHIGNSDKFNDNQFSVESLEYSYNSQSKEFRVADLNKNIHKDIKITDEIINELKTTDQTNLRFKLNGYDINVTLNKFFDHTRDMHGYSTDKNIRSSNVGDALIEATGSLQTDAKVNDVKIVNFSAQSAEHLSDTKMYVMYNKGDNENEGTAKIVFINYEKHSRLGGDIKDHIVGESQEFKQSEFLGQLQGDISSKNGSFNAKIQFDISGDISKISGNREFDSLLFEVSNSNALFDNVIVFSKNIVSEKVASINDIENTKLLNSKEFVDLGSLDVSTDSLNKVDTYTAEGMMKLMKSNSFKFEKIPQDSKEGQPDNDMILKMDNYSGIATNMNEAGHKMIIMSKDGDSKNSFTVNFYSNGNMSQLNDQNQAFEYSVKNINLLDVTSSKIQEGDFESITVNKSSGLGIDAFDDTNLYFSGNVNDAKLTMYQSRNKDKGTEVYESEGKIDFSQAGKTTVTLVSKNSGKMIELDVTHKAVLADGLNTLHSYDENGNKDMLKINLSKAMEHSSSPLRLSDISNGNGNLADLRITEVNGITAGIGDTMNVDLTDAKNAVFTIDKIDGDKFTGKASLVDKGAINLELKDSKGNSLKISGEVFNKFINTDEIASGSVLKMHKSIYSAYGSNESSIAKSMQEINNADAYFDISIGSEMADTTRVKVNKVTSETLNLSDLNISTREDAIKAKEVINVSIADINDARSSIGAFQGRLITAYKSADAIVERVKNAISDLTDLDAPTGYTKLLNDIIRMEGVSQMLTKSFSTPRLLSKLLQSMQ